MSSAPRPQTTSSRTSPENGGTDHSRRIGEDDVRVAEEQHRRPVAAARDPRHQARPLGHARVQLAVRRRSPPDSRAAARPPRSRCRADSSCRCGSATEQIGDLAAETGLHHGAEHTSAVGDLFSDAADRAAGELAPLAQRLRPRALDEFVGQGHVLGEGSALRLAIAEDRVRSSIFYGPPGSGQDDAGADRRRVDRRRRSRSCRRCRRR